MFLATNETRMGACPQMTQRVADAVLYLRHLRMPPASDLCLLTASVVKPPFPSVFHLWQKQKSRSWFPRLRLSQFSRGGV